MTAPAVELRVHRAQTKDFISKAYTDLALVPRVKTRTGAGTVWTDQPARAVQRFRLIDQSGARSSDAQTYIGADGKQRKVRYQLLGEHDAVIGLNDTWVDSDGIRWEVADLMPFNGYERRAQVVRYGE